MGENKKLKEKYEGMMCTACGSSEPHHLKYVEEHGKCVV